LKWMGNCAARQGARVVGVEVKASYPTLHALAGDGLHAASENDRSENDILIIIFATTEPYGTQSFFCFATACTRESTG
jgi:hypothetical protein